MAPSAGWTLPSEGGATMEWEGGWKVWRAECVTVCEGGVLFLFLRFHHMISVVHI